MLRIFFWIAFLEKWLWSWFKKPCEMAVEEGNGAEENTPCHLLGTMGNSYILINLCHIQNNFSLFFDCNYDAYLTKKFTFSKTVKYQMFVFVPIAWVLLTEGLSLKKYFLLLTLFKVSKKLHQNGDIPIDEHLSHHSLLKKCTMIVKIMTYPLS